MLIAKRIPPLVHSRYFGSIVFLINKTEPHPPLTRSRHFGSAVAGKIKYYTSFMLIELIKYFVFFYSPPAEITVAPPSIFSQLLPFHL